MVQTEILNRVFRIRFSTSAATAFTLEHGSTQFIVTAKHLFKDSGYPAQSTIELLINGTYQSFNVDIRYPSNANIDIAVLKTIPYQQISPITGNACTTAGLVFGQDVYFLGYPYNYDTLLTNYPGTNSPMPFVKKACLSGLLSPSPSIIVLDGHNNPGFSGGPVCFKKAGDKLYTIAGVISGYRFDRVHIFDKNDQETEYYLKENTGIINVSDISYATAIAKNWAENP